MPDYEYYTAQYLGEDLPEEQFERYITRASRLMQRYKTLFDVRPRAGLVDAEECAVCAVAEAMYEFDGEDARRGLAGAAVGSVSETYTAPPELCASTLQLRENYYRELAKGYLVFGRWAGQGDVCCVE